MNSNEFISNQESSWTNMIIRDGLDKLEGKLNDSPRFFNYSVIEKIPYIRYPGLSDEQNDSLYAMAREVMIRSKRENNYNEVAITYRFDKSPGDKNAFAIVYGNEKTVNFMADVKTAALIRQTEGLFIANLHNHPSNTGFSPKDMFIFACSNKVKVMEIINHYGSVGFLFRPYDIELTDDMITILQKNIPNIGSRQNDEKDLFELLSSQEEKNIIENSLEIFQKKGIIYSYYMDQEQVKEFKFPQIISETQELLQKAKISTVELKEQKFETNEAVSTNKRKIEEQNQALKNKNKNI